ncbi:hypothetical protein [Actinocrispum sp. NPDC049592]
MGQNGRAGDTADPRPQPTVHTRQQAAPAEADPEELFGETTMTAPPDLG